MIVMEHNYLKDKNVLHVKMFYWLMQVVIGLYQERKILNNANIHIFNKMEEECYLQKILEKKEEDNNI